MTRLALLLLACLLAAASPAPAAAPLTGGGDAPIEISAARSLEWDRKAKTYTAREQARARQGDMEVRSDTLTAHYADVAGQTQISLLVAAGGVEISSPPYTAYGETARYDVAAETATLQGGDLRIETVEESLTAREKIEFDAKANRLTAYGDAVARRGTDRLRSERLDAFFQRDTNGKMALRRIVADQPVTIETARETITGSRGVYDVAVGKATLTGDVRIRQGENWIAGQRAEVDLKTGISRLFATPAGAAAEGGRVRGVFYPEKKQQAGGTAGAEAHGQR